MEDLKKLRDSLDQLDTKIISLLIERMETARHIGAIKRKQNLNIQDKSREQEVISHVEHTVEHPIYKEMISIIYTKMMEESRIVQKFFQENICPYKKIGILGCGLIGGSICKGLKAKDPQIHIGTFSNNYSDAQLALKEGWIDQDYSNMKNLVRESELIVLASPISTIISLAKQIKEAYDYDHPLVILDIASVKKEIVSQFESLSGQGIEFVGTHPMAGKETQGFANSQATLFAGYPWVVVPHKKNSPQVLASVEHWIRYLGAEVIRLNAEEHDRKAALISHLPGIISKALWDFAIKIDEASCQIAGPGFKSMTRLAHSNPAMRNEIYQQNHKNIQEIGLLWIDHLKNCFN